MGKMLCVAEKPSVGKDIAEALGCKEKKQGYIEGDKYIVTWAAGHLITQKKPDEHDPAKGGERFEGDPGAGKAASGTAPGPGGPERPDSGRTQTH